MCVTSLHCAAIPAIAKYQTESERSEEMKRISVTIVVCLTCALLLTSASASAPNWDVTGEWRGNSGLVGNLAYHFVMNLTQTNGDVTGTFYYTNASPVGTITGYVDGNDFYFTRTDTNQNYWATCWPCTISADGTYFHGYGTGPGQNVEWEALGQATNPVMIVMVDIKPGSYPNCFNNDGHGVIPVAVLGSADFDVNDIDPGTVGLEGVAVKAVGKSNKLLASVEDVDGDGFDDLVVKIEDVDGAFTSGSGTATLTGQLWDGTPFEGYDDICIVP
jgi:hypothetical protein